MLMGLGREKIRELPREFDDELPEDCSRPFVFLPGTLVLQGKPYSEHKTLARELAENRVFAKWPVIILVDNSNEATRSMQDFLWTFFTRFEPAADIHCRATMVHRFHVGLTPPIVFDCRMKPWYTDILEVDKKTKQLVDKKISNLIPARWR